MGLKNWMRGEAPEVKEEVAPVVVEDTETLGYTAKITGNEVDGYGFTILKNGRVYEYSGYISAPKKNNASAVETIARDRLKELRKRDTTQLTKVIK